MELSRLFQGRRHEDLPVDARPTVLPLRRSSWSPKNKFSPLDLQSLAEGKESQKAWSDLESRMARYWAETAETWFARNQWKRTGGKLRLWQESTVDIGGVSFHFALIEGFVRPLVLTPTYPEITIPLGFECTGLHILGQVTLPDGFPPTGSPGETVATYTLNFAGGRKQEIPMRTGVEVARANLVLGATRIDPVATSTQRALSFTKDWSREQYQVLLFSLPVTAGRVEGITARLNGQHPPLLLFAITAEQS
jgi:hypothetical protein